MGELVVLGPPGELRISWNRHRKTEVRIAHFAYHTLVREGLKPFIPDPSRGPGAYLPAESEAFDANVERYTFVRPAVGG